ncbi:hypothetical protein HPHPP13_1473 [Helicobacter pylori Hp P-13]|uniref:Uncharacterized protein n=1 Tax=Helicobacter pylori Hp P-13b TaxID=992107 RepID=A0ABC9QPR6_HELPX|nr:hypothetical protein HPHPP13_1473 [Helicobacter pylori Hp P-13]EJC30375.1 hypothetical protein HPHPP13B_1414 [Helicobacter pylori Hp P-13b]
MITKSLKNSLITNSLNSYKISLIKSIYSQNNPHGANSNRLSKINDPL